MAEIQMATVMVPQTTAIRTAAAREIRKLTGTRMGTEKATATERGMGTAARNRDVIPQFTRSRLTELLPTPSTQRSSNLQLIGAAAFLGLFLTTTGIGSGVDRDLQLWRNWVRARPATGRLTLVEIDARSLEAIAHWPWPRRLHAQAIDALNRAGAQTIAFDVDFSAHTDDANDVLLARAIAASPAPVILPTFRQTRSGLGWRYCREPSSHDVLTRSTARVG